MLATEQPRFAGRSLLRYTADLGLLSDRMNIIHAIWMDEADYDLIAESGATVAHNPISNLRLGSGVMPFRKLRERKINICLGTDEAIADDAVNMWGVAKQAALIHTIGDPDYRRWPDADEILDCLFRGGAHAMRRGDQLGAIAVGRLADLVLVDLDTAAFTPFNNVRRQMVFCENGSGVRKTMVAGRIVYDGSKLTKVDERALRAEARSIFAGRKAALEGARTEVARWRPYYEAMVSKAAARMSASTAGWATAAPDPTLQGDDHASHPRPLRLQPDHRAPRFPLARWQQTGALCGFRGRGISLRRGHGRRPHARREQAGHGQHLLGVTMATASAASA